MTAERDIDDSDLIVPEPLEERDFPSEEQKTKWEKKIDQAAKEIKKQIKNKTLRERRFMARRLRH